MNNKIVLTDADLILFSWYTNQAAGKVIKAIIFEDYDGLSEDLESIAREIVRNSKGYKLKKINEAEWREIFSEYGNWSCSNCGRTSKKKFAHCPNCGKKMKGADHDS